MVSRAWGLRLFAALMGFGLGACGGSYVRRGATLYGEGRYIEAAAVFEMTETQVSAADPRQQAEYASYRGLTMLWLGDFQSAQRWMAFAYEIEKAAPGSLKPELRVLVDQGWAALVQRLEQGPVRASPPTTALAASQPPPPLMPPVPAPR